MAAPKKLKMHRARPLPKLKQPRAKDERPNSTRRGYCANWRKLRVMHLASEPLCRMCRMMGKLIPGNEVDHIVPLAIGGARFDGGNLQTLCRPCHQQKTQEDKRKGHVYKSI